MLTTEQFVSDIVAINSKYDDSIIIKAYEIARNLHEGQFRKSGEPYIIHPVAVAKILAGFGVDNETVVAGLLHDVVEDTPYTREQLVDDFDERIALLVDGVTKLGNIKYDSKEVAQAENFRKMFLAMSKDIRVLIIKLADRLHNMRTLEYMPTNKREEKALETLEIYAPLAGRLGIYSIKFELEDLALKYLHPLEYKNLSDAVAQKQESYEENIGTLIESISQSLDESGIKHDVMGRSKHLYSIYRKMVIQKKEIDEIFDLLAVRVLVQSVKDCYAVLGLVHSKWKPIPGRFKDYIAMPKPNMYQSLHTTVFGDNGEPFEVQIRTYEMHRIAEYGIAAHWKYKEGKVNSGEEDSEQKLAWLRQALEWQKESEDSVEFLETMKMDLFNNQVFVFTPRGDVVELPVDSTPLDFAFKVHTDVGVRCVGAKINGKIVPKDYTLNNGDIVEIITSANSSGPSTDWLQIVKSSQAKHKIKQWLRKANKDDDVDRGKSNISNYIKKKGLDASQVAKNAYILKAVKDLRFDNVNDLYLQTSRGGAIVSKVCQKLIDYYNTDNELKEKQEEIKKQEFQKKASVNRGAEGSDIGIVVKGADNLLIRRASCCNPVPGDFIVGYISKGKGINVHREDCTNMVNLNEQDRGRLIDVYWDTPKSGTTYFVDICLEGTDRKGLFSDISKACDDNDITLAGVNMKPVATGDDVTVVITVSISDMHQLQRLMISLRQVNGIDNVYRAKPI
ncbi:MAG: bifunctional (p)ppGpp synthetase/guanosine-3',5'-bis(diphosphate) 3'-pyrophosphohydrolase [Clostridiales bacterium]|nr:bifunctional (p)ppGpp synthetase/guanosine-3',5'-bis(diphosphate) 3'-pyrophosphohydrolase [Candidatus Crickella merdequi]